MRSSTASGGAVVALLLLFLLPAPRSLDAQVRASERGSVSQTVDGTVVEIDYSRPRARGRAPIYGEVVHWGEVWTPGANDATTLEVNRDIQLDGHDVPAGKYSIWMVVQPDEWELVLDPTWDLFHTERPEKTDEQIRFMVTPEEIAPVEVLTFSFPSYSATDATLLFAWGERQVPLRVEVEPSMRRVVSDDEAAPYLGTWEMAFQEDGPFPAATVPFDVDHADDGRLLATTKFPVPGWPDPVILMLMPVAEGAFLPGMVVDGELWDSFEGTVLEFRFDGDEAVGFAFRDDEDEVMARGERKE